MKTHLESHHTNRRLSRRQHNQHIISNVAAQNHKYMGQGPAQQLQALGPATLTNGGIIDYMIRATENNALAGCWHRQQDLLTPFVIILSSRILNILSIMRKNFL
jgi:hypothetical protein